MMSEQQNTNSEGNNRHCEGDFRYCVATACAELTKAFSLNRRGLAALCVAARLGAGRDTRGERGA
jgi:hypothetical protein